MNQLTPIEFHDRLASAMPDTSTDGPLHPAIEADILAGRRLLRRRRGATVLGAAVVVAVLAGGVSLTNGFGDEPSRGTDVAGAPTDEAELLESCRTGEVSAVSRDAIFGSGTPVVKAVAKTDQKIVLAVESADGRYWGDCFVSLVDSEFGSGMSVYDATERTTSSQMSSGPRKCDEQGVCSGFAVSVVDRRVSEVAAVEFLTADGTTTRVDTVDGYYAFAYVGDLPKPVRPDENGYITSLHSVQRITFLDASGTPIAAEAQDGSGSGEDGETIPGLPSITEFPSLRSGEEITFTS